MVLLFLVFSLNQKLCQHLFTSTIFQFCIAASFRCKEHYWLLQWWKKNLLRVYPIYLACGFWWSSQVQPNGVLRTTLWLLSEVREHVLHLNLKSSKALELDACGTQSSASGGAAPVRRTDPATAQSYSWRWPRLTCFLWYGEAKDYLGKTENYLGKALFSKYPPLGDHIDFWFVTGEEPRMWEPCWILFYGAGRYGGGWWRLQRLLWSITV